jgi:mannose-6-phosphate isomerase-like protein (cupin superfamily)
MSPARLLLLLLAWTGAAVAQPAAPAPTTPATAPALFASRAEIDRIVAQMAAELKPGQHFLYHPLLKDGAFPAAALEYWTAPGAPAIHPAQAEYGLVVAGAGTLVSGGRMTNPQTRNPTLVEGDRTQGATTQTLKTGDVFFVPAGVPHWFGITGPRLVLLGIKIDRSPTP